MEVVNLNSLLAGSVILTKAEDKDLKDLFPSLPVQPKTLQGGFRVLNPGLFESVLKEKTTGVLTDHLGNTATVGVVQSNLQTSNYRRYRCAPFPPDATVEYGTVQYDNEDRLRVWMGAYVLGDLRIYDSCAIRWKRSDRYLLIPYTANVYNMDTSHFKNRKYRYVYVSGYPRQCLGTIRSGGLEAVAYNRDLLISFEGNEWHETYPQGFIPVFWPERQDDLALLQDHALGSFLGQFMPEEGNPSIKEIILGKLPELGSMLKDFFDETATTREQMETAKDLIPEEYVTGGWSQKVYEVYISILAATYIRVWNRGIDHLEGRR